MIEQQRYKKNSFTAAQKKYCLTFRPRFSYQVIQQEITVKNRERKNKSKSSIFCSPSEPATWKVASKTPVRRESFILTRWQASSQPHSTVPNSFHLLKEMRFSNELIPLKGKKKAQKVMMLLTRLNKVIKI